MQSIERNRTASRGRIALAEAACAIGVLVGATGCGLRAAEVAPAPVVAAAPRDTRDALRPSFRDLAQRAELAASLEVRAGAPSRARDADLVHLSADLVLDWERGSVHGAVTSWCRALRPGTDELRFAASDIEVREVLDATGRALVWRLDDDAVVVSLGAPLGLGEEEPLRFVFASRPAAGLEFTRGPEALGFAPEIHARGLPRGNRHWLPTLETAADRATLDARFRVGHGMSVVASGRLLETIDHGGGERTFVWRLAEPVEVSAIGFAAGRFEVFPTSAGDVPVALHLPPGMPRDAADADFGVTPRAMAFFGERLAAPYPYPRYDQVVVHGLGVRGLESATASLFDASLVALDAASREDLPEPPRRTVTHELAHHWFGVHVAPLDLRERWLAEAFATWLELEFEAELIGREAVDVSYEELRDELLGGASQGPLHAEDVPAHYYTKGPWVLRMIAGLVGDEGLWRIARTLVAEHAHGFIATEDLRRVALEVTGLELGPLIERWIDGAGLPELDVRIDLAAGTRVGLEVVQRNAPFELALPLDFVLSDGSRVRRTFAISGARHASTEWFGADVVDVVVDPDGRVCARWRITKPLAAWERQVAPTSPAPARWRAVGPLAELAAREPAALQALFRVLTQDPEAGIRRRVLERLASNDPRVAPVLLRVLEVDPHPRVRRAAARALLQLHARGGFEHEPAAAARLVRRRLADPSPAVRAALDELLTLVG